MDYLTRLIAGSNTSPTKQKFDTPAERLALCKKICSVLQQIWRNGRIGPEDNSASIHATNLLARLNTILHDESRKAAPHSCLLFLVSSQTYIILTKLALLSQYPGVIKNTAQIFHVLINGEVEGLLDSKLFSRSLLDLVRYTVIGPRVIVDDQTQADLIELLFEIAAKLRVDPELLPAWFQPERDRSRPRNGTGESRRNQFPLFFVLVQYVHEDGTIGDFARTGLLYLTETASKSKSLETWMIESDLAPQMVSGLVALYSRLSTQFPPLSEDEKALPIIALSDFSVPREQSQQANSDFQQNIKAFLAYLAFWQDTLNHCTSVEVKDTLLDHFQVLFVQQVLYPSLLESSDVKGGSTAAVVIHLVRILYAVDHVELVQRMLNFLMTSSKSEKRSDHHRKHRPRLSMSRRKSIDQLQILAEAANAPSPDLFNLLDLMNMSLKSRQSITVEACLKLLSVLLKKHHNHIITSLFRLEATTVSPQDYSVKSMNDNLLRLFDFANAIGVPDILDQSYQSCLVDARILLERHSCARRKPQSDEPTISERMAIVPDCKLFEGLVALLKSFFANDTLTNIYLTETILALIVCEHLDLHRWLLPSSVEDETSAEDSHGNNVTSTLERSIVFVQHCRSRFPGWDLFLSERRSELAAADDSAVVLEEHPVSLRANMSDAGSGYRSGSPTSSQPSSRPTTPKSRKIVGSEFGSIDRTLSAPSRPLSNPQSRVLASSPLRESFLAGHGDERNRDRQPSSKGVSANEDILNTLIPLPTDASTTDEIASLPLLVAKLQLDKRSAGSPDTGIGGRDSGAVTPSKQDESQRRAQVSLSHILTNAIILQEFILEIAAVVQVRASMFAEVDLQ